MKTWWNQSVCIVEQRSPLPPPPPPISPLIPLSRKRKGGEDTGRKYSIKEEKEGKRALETQRKRK